MSEAPSVNISMYSAELKWTTGSGSMTKSVPANGVMAARSEQKALNKLFKENPDKPPKWKGLPDGIAPGVAPLKTLSTHSENVLPSISAPGNVRPQVTKFKLKLDVGTGNTTFLVGSSKQGKSTLLMHIYDTYYAGRKDMISTLWTGNPHIPLYKGHQRLIVSGTWDRSSEEVINDQKLIQQKTKNKYEFLNMFDDVINVRNSVLMDNLILTYRNANMSSIVSLQYSNLMSKCCRANVNNICAFGMNTDESIQVIVKTFLSGYLRRIGVTHELDQINWYRDMTKDHHFIYIQPAAGIVTFHRL